MWVVGLKDKTGSDEAIRKILLDARSRSGRARKILRTDGDGIFGRSSSFQKLKEEFNFVHERPAPYDHNKSAIVNRESGLFWKGPLLYFYSPVPPLPCGKRRVHILSLLGIVYHGSRPRKLVYSFLARRGSGGL